MAGLAPAQSTASEVRAANTLQARTSLRRAVPGFPVKSCPPSDSRGGVREAAAIWGGVITALECAGLWQGRDVLLVKMPA